MTPPLLTKPVISESLLLYLFVFDTIVSVALACEEGKAQKPIFYIS